jgi:prepilin-type N-terminal cleavage/methylation domain-containing protein
MKVKKRIKIKINRKGFSLIEMMVALGILSLIIIGLVTFFSGGTRAWVTGQYQLEAQRNARLAMDRMVKEIREGKNIISSSDGDTIVVSIPNFDTADPDDYYEVTYSLFVNTLQRDSNPLIDNVQSLSFTYFDNGGNLVAPENASKVHILLEVDVDKDDSPDITLNTDVNLRNYGL